MFLLSQLANANLGYQKYLLKFQADAPNFHYSCFDTIFKDVLVLLCQIKDLREILPLILQMTQINQVKIRVHLR
jgi:hypothetical protein